MNKVTIDLILFYRRYISPYKGYRCAHDYLYCAGSCSDWSLEVLKTKGTSYFFSNFYGRLIECHEAYEKIKMVNDDENSNEKVSNKCCVPIEISCCFFSW